MKTIIITVILTLSLFTFSGCHDITPGYLKADDAGYTPDTLVVKAVLDAEQDKDRIDRQEPWQSSTIDGVQGTFPITYSIKAIHTTDGNSEAAKQIGMQGKGIITIPFDHTIPAGRYTLDVRIRNEGYTVDKDSIFTVIIQ